MALSIRLYSSLPNRKLPIVLSVDSEKKRLTMLFRVTSPFSSCSRSHRCSRKSAPIFIMANTATCAAWLRMARSRCFVARCSSALFASLASALYRAACAFQSPTASIRMPAFWKRWVVNIVKVFTISSGLRWMPARCITV